jgi:CRISPR-associated protein Cas5t
MADSDGTVGVLVDVPIASFRVPYAREYFETYRVPPPSTVFGMLLSLVGERWRAAHIGAEIGIVMLSSPVRSTVLRTMRRVKDLDLTAKVNARPDFQDLLVDTRVAAWVRAGDNERRDPAGRTLAGRVRYALREPQHIERFGALSLGESTHLVNDLRELRATETVRGHLLYPSASGSLTLPVWPDHVGSSATRWGRYEMVEFEGHSPPDDAWQVCAPLHARGQGD